MNRLLTRAASRAGRRLAAAVLLLAGSGATVARPAGLMPPLVGVNLSGAELNGSKQGARVNFDYVYPSAAELGWAASRGMTAIRLPVVWERLQPVLGGPLDPSELTRLDAVLDEAAQDGLSVVVDLHNYGFYRSDAVGSAAVPDTALADLWRRVALHERNRPGAVFGLMNEPHTMAAARWRVSAEAALRAIRATGSRNLVLVSGTNWDGAHDWAGGGERSNADVMAGLTDPAGRTAFEFHQYLDRDYSGTHPDCLSPQAAVATLEPATAWLERGHRHGFLGEFGVTTAPPCLAAMDAMLSYLDRHRDAWIGWTYWAAGPWWGHYMFSAEPGPGGHDTPQALVLMRHLPQAGGATR